MPTALIVDDIAENLYLLEVILKGNGFEVRTARNGAEALEAARQHAPDLVISDILMPVMDGYALCREWRTDPQLCRVPFIFYTATFVSKKDEELALDLGADRFVIKPQEPEALLAIVREVMAASGDCAGAVERPSCHREGDLLKGYNDALFRKLEKKMIDLEQANRALEKQMGEQKRLEEQLRQAQKLEAVGRFSAGIAHDFNNILTAIIGFGSIIKIKLEEDHPLQDKVDQILAAADRATNLTRSLLTFSRKQELEMKPLNLNSCLKNLEAFLRRIIGEDIRLVITPRAEDLPIFADGGNLEQVLVNLVANARDALPQGGLLSISTEGFDIDEEFIRMHGYGTPGRYALLVVADNGIGMDEETRQRIFEPFFTTKGPDKGTGLGLAISYGIVKQHNGFINVYSEPNHGTTVKILLPLLATNAEAAEGRPESSMLVGGTETILVVDDEAAILKYIQLFLTSLGYSVLLARDGREAVEVFREKGERIDLILMDLILPNKSGRETARELMAMGADLKIIFTSGYPYDLIHERKLLEEGAPLLMKPLTPSALAQKVRGVLDHKIT